MASKTDHVIIAYFAGKDQAATAADEIKDWDKASDAIKLGGIGLLTWQDGKVKSHKLSRVKAGKGAKLGLAVGAATAILSGGATLVGGAVVGAAAGAVGAKLFHQSLGLTAADNTRLEKRLRDGRAAVVVMTAADEVEATKGQLAVLGGEVEDYQVPLETMAQVEQATEVREEEAAEPVQTATTAEPAAQAAAPTVVLLPGSLESVEGIGPSYVADLKALGITTKRGLLLAGATPEGRARIAGQSKISEKLILKWVSAVDLSRVKGVRSQNGELLVAGGVSTVGALAEQEAGALHGRLAELNAAKKLVGVVPGAATMGEWIESAKGLPQMVTL